ncbi:MAG: hypothetical protein ACTSVH_08200 [Candidatus Heimdallarchaeota archaeon]
MKKNSAVSILTTTILASVIITADYIPINGDLVIKRKIANSRVLI